MTMRPDERVGCSVVPAIVVSGVSVRTLKHSVLRSPIYGKAIWSGRLIDAEAWFFSTPEWAIYLAAYGRPHAPHTGPSGNLVVRLGPQEQMWARVSKGHRADIAHASRLCSIGQGSEHFDRYRALHRDVNGQVRPAETFEVMRSWLPEHALLVVAERQTVEAAAYFIVHGQGTYYASGVRRASATRGAAHLILWTAMKRLAAFGYRWLDMGPAPSEDASDKVRSIAAFKEHFGAERIAPWEWRL